jgi:hypothetical protein
MKSTGRAERLAAAKVAKAEKLAAAREKTRRAHLRLWAEAIVNHYGRSRGAGSTYLQRHGWEAENPVWQKIVVFAYPPMADERPKGPRYRVLSLRDHPGILCGRSGPLVIEHRALAEILAALLHHE